MSVTPVSEKTVSFTSQPKKAVEGPMNEFKKPMNQRSYFCSPTDALVSPCTQKLMNRRLPRNPMVGSQKLKYELTTCQTMSSVDEKENQSVETDS